MVLGGQLKGSNRGQVAHGGQFQEPKLKGESKLRLEARRKRQMELSWHLEGQNARTSKFDHCTTLSKGFDALGLRRVLGSVQVVLGGQIGGPQGSLGSLGTSLGAPKAPFSSNYAELSPPTGANLPP